jgi:heme exporter protein C
MKKLGLCLYAALTAALLAWGFYQAIYVAPDEQTMHEVQRIFYYHVPSAMTAFLFFAISLAGSIGFLALHRDHPQRAQVADAWAVAAAEVGVVFCTVVLITGPLWGHRVWWGGGDWEHGSWWTWDARLTTTLVLWLLYVSYLLLRRFTAEAQMQTLAAVLGVFAALDVPIVYMSTRWWRTQHPAPVFGGGPDSGIKDSAMLRAFGWNVAAWLAWGLLILALRYRIERQHQQLVARQAQAALEEI